MKRFFYVGEGPENDALFAEAMRREVVCAEARTRLMHDYGADALYMNRNEVLGLVFKEKLKSTPFTLEHTFPSGGFAYEPDSKSSAGKKLGRRLVEEKILHFDPLRFIGETLGVLMFFSVGRTEYGTVIGYSRGRILLSNPWFPLDVPPWLKEVDEDEWVRWSGSQPVYTVENPVVEAMGY